MKVLFILLASTLWCAPSVIGQQTQCGIGADILITHWTQGDHLQIVGVASNSPAAQAGLAPDQFILAIDGTPTTGLKFADCVRRIQGKAGTKVVLKIADWRHGWTNSIEVLRKILAEDPLAVDTSKWVEIPEAQKDKALMVTTNQTLRVSRSNGTIAIIQFTQFGTTNAYYRWRSRSATDGMVHTGAGAVFENYDWRTNAYGEYLLTHRGSPDDLKIKAGEVRLTWSSSNTNQGWLYYYPLREKVEVLDWSVFDSGRW